MLPSWTVKASPAAFMSATRPGTRARASAVKPVSPIAPKANGRDVAAGAAMAGAARVCPMSVTPRPSGTSHRLSTAASNHPGPAARQMFPGGPWARNAAQPEADGVPGGPGASGGPGGPGGSGAGGGRGGDDGGFGGLWGRNCSGGTGIGMPGTAGAAAGASASGRGSGVNQGSLAMALNAASASGDVDTRQS